MGLAFISEEGTSESVFTEKFEPQKNFSPWYYNLLSGEETVIMSLSLVGNLCFGNCVILYFKQTRFIADVAVKKHT